MKHQTFEIASKMTFRNMEVSFIPKTLKLIKLKMVRTYSKIKMVWEIKLLKINKQVCDTKMLVF